MLSLGFMRDKLVIALIALHGICGGLEAAPQRQQERTLYDVVNELRHQGANCEAELELCKEKLETQERILETLYRDQAEGQRQTQELIRSKVGTGEQRLLALESALPLLHGDILALKSHLEKLTTTMVSLQNKLSGVEEIVAQQGQMAGHLQAAMQTLAAAMQTESPTPEAIDSNAVYCVKEGDSLGKIAQRYGVTVKVLKEKNGLTSDKIRIGQPLAIPK